MLTDMGFLGVLPCVSISKIKWFGNRKDLTLLRGSFAGLFENLIRVNILHNLFSIC